MTKDRFDVAEHIHRKSREWQETLTEVDRELIREQLAQPEIPTGAGLSVDKLCGYTQDDRKMAKVVLEAMGRFAPFEEVIDDARVRLQLEQPMFAEAVTDAAVLYNTALARRSGMHAEGDKLVIDDAALTAKRDQWVANLPDYQVEEIATRVAGVTYPGHVINAIAPAYSRPEILPELVKQSVQDVRGFGEFLSELRDWGTLDFLDTKTVSNLRRAYNTLVSQGFDVAIDQEIAARRERRAESITTAAVVSAFEGKYTQPELLESVIETAAAGGKSFAELIGDLRAFGELAHLNSVDYNNARRDYEALQVKAGKSAERTQGWRERVGGPRQVQGSWTATVEGREPDGSVGASR